MARFQLLYALIDRARIVNIAEGEKILDCAGVELARQTGWTVSAFSSEPEDQTAVW